MGEDGVVEAHPRPPLGMLHGLRRHRVAQDDELAGDGGIVHPDEGVAGIEEHGAERSRVHEGHAPRISRNASRMMLRR